MSFDREVPLGNPTSLTCRWCYDTKTVVAETRFCRGCDGRALAIARANEATA